LPLAIVAIGLGLGVEPPVVELRQPPALEGYAQQALDLAHDRLILRLRQGQRLDGLIDPPTGR